MNPAISVAVTSVRQRRLPGWWLLGPSASSTATRTYRQALLHVVSFDAAKRVRVRQREGVNPPGEGGNVSKFRPIDPPCPRGEPEFSCVGRIPGEAGPSPGDGRGDNPLEAAVRSCYNLLREVPCCSRRACLNKGWVLGSWVASLSLTGASQQQASRDVRKIRPYPAEENASSVISLARSARCAHKHVNRSRPWAERSRPRSWPARCRPIATTNVAQQVKEDLSERSPDSGAGWWTPGRRWKPATAAASNFPGSERGGVPKKTLGF